MGSRMSLLGIGQKWDAVKMERKLYVALGPNFDVTEEGVFVNGALVLHPSRALAFLHSDATQLIVPGAAKLVPMEEPAVPVAPLPAQPAELDISWDYEDVEGGFKCRYCGKVLKVRRSMERHIDNKVCRSERR